MIISTFFVLSTFSQSEAMTALNKKLLLPSDGKVMILKSKETRTTGPSSESIEIAVSEDSTDIGKFTIGKTNGQILLYGHPTPETSVTTIRIDGADYTHKNLSQNVLEGYPVIDSNRNTTKWTVTDNIVFTQYLTLVSPLSNNVYDTVEIKYEVTNNDSNSHAVGLRIMLDTMLGSEDGAPFRVPEVGAITYESEFSNTIPPYIDIFDYLTNPTVQAKATFVNKMPDRLLLANWTKIVKTSWDYEINPEDPFLNSDGNPDTSIAAYWYPEDISPNTTKTYVMYYGLNAMTVIVNGNFASAISAPDKLQCDSDNNLVPNPFVSTLYIENSGNAEIKGATATLTLPTGLSLLSGEFTKNLGDFQPNEQKQISWNISADIESAGNLNFSINLSAETGAEAINLSKTIFIPEKMQESSDDNDIIGCSYTPFPYDEFVYGAGGQFSYKLYSSRVEKTNAPIGKFVVQPRDDTTANGYFEVNIEGQNVDLYSSSDMEASDLIGKKYEYPQNTSNEFVFYFFCDFNIDTDIILKQIHGEREIITKEDPWIMVTQCPNCQQLLVVSAKSHNNRKRSQLRSNTVSEETVFDYPGGTGEVQVRIRGYAGNNCGWTATTKQSWITLTSEASGSGNGTIYFKVDKNNQAEDRTGSIEVFLDDGNRIADVTILQYDKRLNSIEINYPSTVLNENGIRYINETDGVNSSRKTEALFTITAYFDGGYSTEFNKDFNLYWYVDSPDYAEIAKDGKLSALNVDQDSVVKITAVYYYKNFGSLKTSPREHSVYLTIKDITELTYMEIKGEGSADEHTSKNRYSVIAYFSNAVLREKDVTNSVVWDIDSDIAFISQDGLLTVNSVDEATFININASYTYKVTKEKSFTVEIYDKTQLDRISISGKSNVKSNDRSEYTVNAYFVDERNDPNKDITDKLKSYTLDSKSYDYADLNRENNKLVLTTQTVDTPENITINVSYEYKEIEYRASFPVIIGPLHDWDIAISSEKNSIDEGAQLNLKAIQTIDNQEEIIDVTDSAIWSIVEDSSNYASIDQGILSANMIQDGDKQIFVKACFSYLGTTQCDSLNIKILDLTELYLDISGSDTITEGENGDYYATANWTNEDDEDISNSCIWTISAPEYASITVIQEDNKAILTGKNVSSNEQVTIMARYSAHGKTASSSKLVTIQKIPEMDTLIITGPEEVNEKTSNHQYEAKAILDNGDEVIVTDDCKWSISDSDLGFITGQGALTVNSVYGDQTIMISAAYTRVNIAKNTAFPVVIREVPEFFTIKGDINFEESVEGTLVVKACMADDETCYTHADIYKVEWDNVGSETSQTYTSDIDFDKGTLANLNHDAPYSNQLQMNTENKPFPFIVVACSDRGTAVRINTETGEIIGEYWTSPDSREKNPSRTTVDLYGNVWIGNRNETEDKGSVVKIGLVVGGTRCNSDGSLNSEGEYLKPPFVYNTCVDRDGDGLIKTSKGLGNILDWSNLDSLDTDGGVETADDEAILLFVRVNGLAVRHVSVNADNNVWIGGYTNQVFDYIDGSNGEILATVDLEYGGYGGLIDQHGVLWSSSRSPFGLLRYDTNGTHEDTSDDSTLFIEMSDGYGMSIDNYGNIWHAQGIQNTIYKIDSDGNIYEGFPKTSGGGGCTRGVAVTPIDNNVWIANSHGYDSQEIGEVCRLDNDGNFLKYIQVGKCPTGVAVDANGFVWVSNQNSSNVMRIDPNGGEDNLGTVDLTVDLGDGARPYNYSDMTGIIAVQTAAQGSWNVIHSSSNLQAEWTKLEWTSEEPEGTSIKTFVRASDTQSTLTTKEFIEIENGAELQDIIGKYIEVQVLFNRSSEVNVSPILYDITITEKLPNSMPYKLVVPEIEQYNKEYNIVAFIDIDNNDINDNCEPTGAYLEYISTENLNADFSLVIPDTCPRSGLALDMYLSSDIPYEQNMVSYVGIEEQTPGILEAGDYVYIGVVAQNVTNLDTFQFDIVYESDKLEYIDAFEKDNQGGTPSFLNINGGTTIGFMDRNVNDRVTIANTLVGKSCDEAPEGSGIIAFLLFEVIDKYGDKTLTIENVSFQNDCDEKNEKIENLKGGIILGEDPVELKSDFNGDCIVNYLDLGIFANCWLKTSVETGWSDCEKCNLDLTTDVESLDVINYLDLGKFAGEWLLKCDTEDTK